MKPQEEDRLYEAIFRFIGALTDYIERRPFPPFSEKNCRTSVFLFESANWSRDDKYRPAFAVGGFPLPEPAPDSRILSVPGNTFEFPPSGGYVELIGRRRYLANSSASLLVMPPLKGDPCLNHLHIVPRTLQQEHYHPSDRIGLVVRGFGTAVYSDGHLFDLKPGVSWRLPAGEVHHFETGEHSLDIIVYHPDSAWGPTDEYHQILNATILPDGTPATITPAEEEPA